MIMGYMNCENEVKKAYLDSPVPIIGMYIAMASAACLLSMAADALNAFRSKKFRFPCKYFCLHALSLTVLAVTMKLPVDFSGEMDGVNDKLARISSLLLMSTAMGNLMTSLGSMKNDEIVLNVRALGILVITIAVNVCIRIGAMYRLEIDNTVGEEVASTFLMLLMLLMLCSFAVMVPSANRYIDLKYNELHKTVSNKEVEWGESTADELKIVVKKYWVMAATGSPEFVMARSVISGTLGLMCLWVALTLVEAYVLLHFLCCFDLEPTTSNYKWSINWILYIQSIGVVFGTVIPLLRWYVVVWFKISDTNSRLRDEFKIQNCWASRLEEWRKSSLPVQIRHHKCKKLLHDATRLLLNICIGVQILLVLINKLVLLILATLGNAVFMCVHHNDMRGTQATTGTEMDFSPYVLLHEGEPKLPKKILKTICNEADKLIQIGQKKQPKNLIELLKKNVNFNGVREFDSNEVPSLHSQEPPNCWSLPVVTLTSIAIALPNIMTDNADQLLRRVSEGLSVVKLIEKILDRNGEVESIRKAADVVWLGVEMNRKWQDKVLQSPSVRGRTHKETLQKLSDIAKKTVEDFVSKEVLNDIPMKNPLNWPVEAIAANSMYRVTESILLANKDENLFERLSVIISDILAACLTNLVHVITLMCHRNTILERQQNVRQAAILLGEISVEIPGILQQRGIPKLDPEKFANIDKWREFMEQDIDNPSASSSASSDNTANPQPSGDDLSVEVKG